ncbi:MAG: ATP-binding cassette domain-containing protein [Patescibacteria group bacterium]|nr:ATP-binding cassette domain-containing protein [Patescibacteria group bacterium]
MKPIIAIKNVNFTYNKAKDNEFQALTNVSMDVYPEEYVVIFGPSGCGKSTLLNVIAGLEKPDNGIVEVLDRDLMVLSAKEFAIYHRSQVGMIYQAYNLITSLTVLDNVALPQIFLNASKRKREKWGLTLLKRFGILKQAKKIPTELSGGQQQRIGIARAIVNNPQIVLADEPVGNLDSVSSKNVLTILRELNEKEKKTIILVTHNPENLEYADRIISMKDGLITGETINRNRNNKSVKQAVQKSPTVEIRDLMRAYRGLSPEQINILIMPYKAKVFSHHFITSRNMEETRVLEEVIQRRLLGTISLEEFFDILHRSSDEGGVGFDVRTAEKIIRRVNRIIRIAYFIYRKGRQKKNIHGRHDKITIEEKTEKMVKYLFNTCYHEYYENLNNVQINRFKKAIKDRLNAALNKTEFYHFLDLPFDAGGMGLNRKTARAITEEMELVLILGFGISQKPDEQAGSFNSDSKNKINISDVSEVAPKGKDRDQDKILSTDKENIQSENTAQIDKTTKILADKGITEIDSDDSELNAGEEAVPGNQEHSSSGQVNDKEILQAVNDAIVSMDVGGMKDFAEVMKVVMPRFKGKVNEAKLTAVIEKAIIEKNK